MNDRTPNQRAGENGGQAALVVMTDPRAQLRLSRAGVRPCRAPTSEASPTSRPAGRCACSSSSEPVRSGCLRLPVPSCPRGHRHP